MTIQAILMLNALRQLSRTLQLRRTMGPRYCLLASGLTCYRLVAHSRLTKSLLVARPQQLCLMTLLHQPEVRSTSSLHGSWLLALKQKQICKA